jgi:hypothetical protein
MKALVVTELFLNEQVGCWEQREDYTFINPKYIITVESLKQDILQYDPQRDTMVCRHIPCYRVTLEEKALMCTVEARNAFYKALTGVDPVDNLGLVGETLIGIYVTEYSLVLYQSGGVVWRWSNQEDEGTLYLESPKGEEWYWPSAKLTFEGLVGDPITEVKFTEDSLSISTDFNTASVSFYAQNGAKLSCQRGVALVGECGDLEWDLKPGFPV